jgi:hypothetical protein
VVLTVPSTLHRLSTGVLITLRERVIDYTRERVDKLIERENEETSRERVQTVTKRETTFTLLWIFCDIVTRLGLGVLLSRCARSVTVTLCDGMNQ